MERRRIEASAAGSRAPERPDFPGSSELRRWGVRCVRGVLAWCTCAEARAWGRAGREVRCQARGSRCAVVEGVYAAVDCVYAVDGCVYAAVDCGYAVL